MNPNLKKALWPVLALVFGALATYFSTGCSGAALPPEVKVAAQQGLCVESAVKAAGPLDKLDAQEAIALAKAVKECFEPAPAPAADAGQ